MNDGFSGVNGQKEMIDVRKFSLRYFLFPLGLIFALLLVNVMLAKMENHSLPANFPAFHTYDLEGNNATNDVFIDKFTVLILWIINDESSKQLFSDLAHWQSEEQLDLQIIGLMGDVKNTADSEKMDKAREITAPFPFTQLLVNDDMMDFLTKIKTAPTIFFIDGEGKIIGQPVVGQEIDLIKKEAYRLMTAGSSENTQKAKLQEKLFH